MEGSLWSGNLFSFTSSIDNLLDNDDVTIEQLLSEDDLLQELKSNNGRLIDKMCERASVEAMVRYMTEPAPADSSDLREHKYPYMACEVVCCEVDGVTEVLIEHCLPDIFRVVTSSEPAPYRLAGYFEKTLQVIFNAKPLAVLTFIDKSGATTLMKSFCKQLHSYSVMQALRALLLPALQLHSSGGNMHDYNGPLGAGSLGGEGGAAADMPAWLMPPPATAMKCDWHRHPETLMLVMEVLTAPPLAEITDGAVAGRHEDARAHASELLIAVLETAGAASTFHAALTSAQALPAFANAAVPPLPDLQNSAAAAERLLSGDAAMAAALSVLEVAVVQMADEHAAMVVEAAALAKMLNSSSSSSSSEAEQVPPPVGASNGGGRITEESARLLAECVPRVAAYLASHATDARTVACQAPAPPPGSSETTSRQPQLGLARLKLVNFLDALVKLQHPVVDASLTANRVPSLLLDLFMKYEWNSLLHQSVSSIVVHLAEGSCSKSSSSGENARAALQANLFVDANLPGRLMELFERASANEEKRKKAKPGDQETLPRFSKGLAHGRPGNFGHGVIMCEAVMKGIANGTTDNANSSSAPIADLVSQSSSGSAWHDFMLSKLADVTAQQCRPLGGFAYPSRQEDVMVGLGDSGGGGSGNDDDGNNDDDSALNDEALAEQISKLGGLNFSGENGDDDSDDDEGEAELALALAKAYNLQGASSGSGDNSGGSSSSSGGKNDSAVPSWASHDDDSDDEEEAAALAMALAKQYGIKGTALGGQRPADEDEVPRVGIGDSSSDEEEDTNGGGSGSGGFADFDAFGGSGSGGSDVAMGASRSEADDFANWGDHHATSGSDRSGSNGDGFADFADFGAPAVPPPSGAPPSPASTKSSATDSTARSPNPPIAASPTEEESGRRHGGPSGSPMQTGASGKDLSTAATSPGAAPGTVGTALNFDAFGATPAPAPESASFDAFGSGVSAPESTFDAFGATPAPAPDPATFEAFGSGASVPAPAPESASFDAFGSGTPAPAPAPESASFDAFGSGTPAPAPAPESASFDAFGSGAPAPESTFDAFGATPAPAPESASFDAFGSGAPAPESTFDAFGQISDSAADAAPVSFPDPFTAATSGPDHSGSS